MKISISQLAREKIIEQTPIDLKNPVPVFVWMLSDIPNNYIRTSQGFKKAPDGYWRMVLGWYERENVQKEMIIVKHNIEMIFDAANLAKEHDEAIIFYSKRFDVSFL